MQGGGGVKAREEKAEGGRSLGLRGGCCTMRRVDLLNSAVGECNYGDIIGT